MRLRGDLPQLRIGASSESSGQSLSPSQTQLRWMQAQSLHWNSPVSHGSHSTAADGTERYHMHTSAAKYLTHTV